MLTKPTPKKVSIGKLKQRTQDVVNLYVRLRDCGGRDGGANCISCQKYYPFAQLQGGHFIAVGGHEATRYDERNINAQCVRCNHFLSGNGRPYYIAMVKKYGQEVVDELHELAKPTKGWKEWELVAIRDEYKEKIKCYS